MPTPTLAPQQRQILLDTLARFSLFGGPDPAGRTLLLANLPAELKSTLARSSIPIADLATLVDTAQSWGTLADGRVALLVLIEGALGLMVGSEGWQVVDTIRQELTTPTVMGRIIAGPATAIHALVLTPEGQQAFTWSTDGTLRRWDLAAATPPATLPVRRSGIRALVAAPAGQGFYLVAGAGTLEYWPFAADAPLAPAQYQGGDITALALLPSGQQALVGTDTGQVVLLDLADGAVRQEFTASGMSTGHGGRVQAALVTVDGRCFTATSRSVRQWNPVTGRELIHYTIPDNRWIALTLLPDGQRLLFSTGDHHTRVWDLVQRRTITELIVPGDPVFNRVLATTPDGATLVAGRVDGALAVWEPGAP